MNPGLAGGSSEDLQELGFERRSHKGATVFGGYDLDHDIFLGTNLLRPIDDAEGTTAYHLEHFELAASDLNLFPSRVNCLWRMGCGALNTRQCICKQRRLGIEVGG
jgi:hypothetical protein